MDTSQKTAKSVVHPPQSNKTTPTSLSSGVKTASLDATYSRTNDPTSTPEL